MRFDSYRIRTSAGKRTWIPTRQGPFSTERKRPNKRNRMKKLFLTIGFAASTLMLAAQPSEVARGSMPTEGSWENTVSSLRNAQKLGVYGVEFDVNMTADDSLIVYHGPKDSRHETSCAETASPEIRAVKFAGQPRNPHPPGVLRTGTERPVDQTDPRNQETRDAATRDAGRGGDPPSGARNAARAADRIHLVQPARLRRSAPPQPDAVVV